ncbi:methyl-accepting chemotaxis protein [Paenibacillus nanensis]|uniref:Methyl-accepting chemotaxis protein n=1 Tax=Paenibacillus nanensis TaxID=393251 RepID=A0A3A1UZJ5_9BACL|nr:methyl-accepting chemotaxis protein [Paenibacillus nanensis]RIX53685.1 methyl-accepting chemotaxis protein [Paenibacillus nanensis]
MMNLSIKARLTVSYVLIVAALVGLGGYALISLDNVNQQSTIISEKWLPGVDDANSLNTITSDYRIYELRFTYAETKEDISTYKQKAAETKQAFDEKLAEVEANSTTELEKESISQLKSSWSQYFTISKQIFDLIEQGKRQDAIQLMANDSRTVFDQASGELLSLVQYNREQSDLASKRGDEGFDTAFAIMITVIVITTLVVILLAVFITRSITQPIRKLSDAAKKLAEGDVNVNVQTTSRDEIGELMNAFGQMIESIREQSLAVEKVADGDLTVHVRVRSDRDLLGKKLQEMIERNNEILTNISHASDQVASGSKQVSDSSISLSQGATEQASAVEELTASLEEVSSQTKLNAANANEANQLAESSKQNALQGNEQMKDMLNAMQDINEASSSISKIIKVIDEIAFQTNILALNAAVEAARAGQHGKGFAVVAEEVRNLAARSANAAKETTTMIEGSILKVQDGTRIADKTAEALRSIVLDIEKVADLVGNIAVASTEQAAAITQINQGIAQVSQVVQTNSATSEESAAASEELSGQASMLRQQVSRFKLKRGSYGQVSDFEEMSPEVRRMLDQMNSQPKRNASMPQIALSDSEFGKY